MKKIIFYFFLVDLIRTKVFGKSGVIEKMIKFNNFLQVSVLKYSIRLIYRIRIRCCIGDIDIKYLISCNRLFVSLLQIIKKLYGKN